MSHLCRQWYWMAINSIRPVYMDIAFEIWEFSKIVIFQCLLMFIWLLIYHLWLIHKNQHLSLNFTERIFDLKYLSIDAFPQNEDFHLLIRQNDNIFHRLGFKSKWHINGLLALALIGAGLLKYYGKENRFLSSEVHRSYSLQILYNLLSWIHSGQEKSCIWTLLPLYSMHWMHQKAEETR